MAGRGHGRDTRAGTGHQMPAGNAATVVLHVGGLNWASEKAVAERVLGRRPGVRAVEANPVSQTATVTFDTAQTSVAGLRRWVEECGYHCAGQSVPSHVCDPMAEPDPADGHRAVSAGHAGAAATAPQAPPGRRDHVAHPGEDAGAEAPPAQAAHEMAAEQAGQEMPTGELAGHAVAAGERAGQEMAAGEGMPPAREVMGHGGAAGMSMEAMSADMRNRFLVAAVLSVPILLLSSIGRDVLGFTVAAPFGLRDDVWLLLLSMPVIFYSAWIFFDGAARALRARTLDMMVLVAVAIGAGWLYSLVVTLTGGGDTFYEAATVLAAFVLLGHWFEMRARGGANDAIRTLLDLAPPRAAAVERESEHPLAEAVVTRAEDLGVPVARAEEFENVPGHGALARVDGQKVAVGNARLMAREGIDLGTLAGRREEMSSAGRTVVCVAVDGRAAALIGIADAPRPTSGGSRLDAGRGRSRGRHADRGQRGHRPADRRAARRADSDR